MHPRPRGTGQALSAALIEQREAGGLGPPRAHDGYGRLISLRELDFCLSTCRTTTWTGITERSAPSPTIARSHQRHSPVDSQPPAPAATPITPIRANLQRVLANRSRAALAGFLLGFHPVGAHRSHLGNRVSRERPQAPELDR
jgi:hypothetical protein